MVFFQSRILPSLEYVIYIDVDTIVKHDINELWECLLKTDKLMLAVERYNGIYISLYYRITCFLLVYDILYFYEFPSES